MPIARLVHAPSPALSWRDRVVAESPEMQSILDLVSRVAPSRLPILILGETGVGKEVVARAIHEASGAAGAFVPVNCAALPASLAESELFGHAQGAFTGAVRSADGLFREADLGTLFLDEVGDLDLPIQAKLLRVLEDGAVRRLGATGATPVAVRILAASNRDLRVLMRENHFRSDLYHRLAGVTITIPPVRDRSEDIPPLVRRFLAEVVDTSGLPAIPPETMHWLAGQSWTGNCRELRLAVERAALLGGEVLYPEDFAIADMHLAIAETAPVDWIEGKTLSEIEAAVIQAAIIRYGGIRPAARALRCPRSTLGERARRLGLSAHPR